jgi:hypothetical protein
MKRRGVPVFRPEQGIHRMPLNHQQDSDDPGQIDEQRAPGR